jgi:hypothetical protein
MFWERITIENASTIVLERDIVNGVIRWSVKTANRTATGEAKTVTEAFAAAVKAAVDQQKEVTDRALLLDS